MITSTEDNFDVDYDIFSWTGRAALLTGGIYAVDKSIKEGIFKRSPKNLGTFNNAHIANVADLLRTDLSEPKSRVRNRSYKHGKNYFDFKPQNKDMIKVGELSDEMNLKKLQKYLNTTGFEGFDAGLMDELVGLQSEVASIDNMGIHSKRKMPKGMVSGRMRLNVDKNGVLRNVFMESKMGLIDIGIADKMGNVLRNGNVYAARQVMQVDPGFKVGQSIGFATAYTRNMKTMYSSMMSGDKSYRQVQSTYDPLLNFNGKFYDEGYNQRLNPDVVKNIVYSAINDPGLAGKSPEALEMIMKAYAVDGLGLGSASNVADGIIRLMGDTISKRDGQGFTSNPNQMDRANTFFFNNKGEREYLKDFNILYADDEELELIRQVAEKKGYDFGDLAKEEMIASGKTGYAGDNSRSINFRNDKMSEASNFLLDEMVKATGLSKEEFFAKVKANGFDAFDDATQRKLRGIGINDFHAHLKVEKAKAAIKRKAILRANGSQRPRLMAEKERLEDLRNVLKGTLKGNKVSGVGEPGMAKLGKDHANRLLKIYKRTIPIYERGGEAKLKEELEQVKQRIKRVNKLVKNYSSQSEDYKAARQVKGTTAYTQMLNSATEEVQTLTKKIGDANYLGINRSGEDSVIKKVFRDAFINNLHVDSESGVMTMGLLKKYGIDQGFKAVDDSGENKAVVKKRIEKLSEVLTDAHILRHGSITPEQRAAYKNVHFLSTAGALKNELSGRTIRSHLHSIREHNKINSNEKVSSLLDAFDKTSKTDYDYGRLAEDLVEAADGQINSLMGSNTGIGYMKKKMLAAGAAAEDLGAGDLGYISKRHIDLMLGLGLKNFAMDVVSRKLTSGMVKTNQRINASSMSMVGGSNKGLVNLTAETVDNFLGNVFPEVFDPEETGTVLDKRKAFLENIISGGTDDGTAFISLGRKVDGIDRIPVFTDHNLLGLIGEQIGNNDDFKKYAEIDDLTKRIIEAVYKDPERKGYQLEGLVTAYKEAYKQLSASVEERIWKDKISHSILGQAGTGNKSLTEYSRILTQHMGTKKNAMPFVAAVSDRKFDELFGEGAAKKYKARGKYAISDHWAFMVREPVEGTSGMPVNVVPGSSHNMKDLSDARIALVYGQENSLLNTVFGDYDGDQLSLTAARTQLGAEELKKLGFSDNAEYAAYRLHQSAKAKFTLKGKANNSLFAHTMANARLSSFLSKKLEKDFVGIVSKSFEPLHAINRKLYAGTEDFSRNATLLQSFAENVIKGKWQSEEDLVSKRSMDLLNSIIGNDKFSQMSKKERIGTFRGFLDELFLGNASKHAEKIRAGDRSLELHAAITNDLVNQYSGNDATKATDKMRQFASERATDMLKQENNAFIALTSDHATERLMELTAINKSKGKNDIAEGLRVLEKELLGEEQLKLIKKAEQVQELYADTKKSFSGLSKNVAMYALAPAAALGLLGTVFGARSSIESEIEFSDSTKNHDRAGSQVYRPLGSTNFKNPTYMKPEMKGGASSGFKIDRFASQHRAGSMRIQDDSRSFDYHDMQDKVRRGY